MKTPQFFRTEGFRILHFNIQLADNSGAAGAQALFVGFKAMHPAAGAFFTLGFCDTNGQGREVSAVSYQSAFLGSFPITGGYNANFSKVYILAGKEQVMRAEL